MLFEICLYSKTFKVGIHWSLNAWICRSLSTIYQIINKDKT